MSSSPIPIKDSGNGRKSSGSGALPPPSISTSARSTGSAGSPPPQVSTSNRQQQLLWTAVSSPGIPNTRRRALSVSMASADYLAEQMADPQATISRALRSRNGAVLAKRTILKRDHFQRAALSNVDYFLEGAPNFRAADLNVFGVSQPTTVGLATILTLLKCTRKPASISQRQQHALDLSSGSNKTKLDGETSYGAVKVLWFNTREEPIIYINGMPFVLRDSESPKQNIRTYAGISADRLEQMESRLKDDVLKESQRFGGLVLVHDELDSGEIVPTWCAATQVQTSREIFDSFIADGYEVLYNRIPISPEQRPDDKYLDEYVSIIRKSLASDALVFNCGLGVGRTTFALVAALLIRRAQLINSGHDDPYSVGQVRPEMVHNEQTTMLRLVYVLEKGLKSKMSPHSAIEWALARSSLIDSLRNAIMGNYHHILSLASVLENGQSDKRLLDIVINRCDAMVNLREEILVNRVRHTIDNTGSYLERAHGFLERYFFLLCFAAYANESLCCLPQSQQPALFSQWMFNRPEIANMLNGFRKQAPDLLLFRPVEDLSVFSNVINPKAAPGEANELENLVIKNRNGTVLVSQTILKVDIWSSEIAQRSVIIGAPNFRQVDGFAIFAVAQPTYDGVLNVLAGIQRKHVVWINLREEPLIYIYGSPYVLRDRYFTLRNLKSYVGITAHRLELLENRLKEDIVKELESYDEKILLHEESNETVAPVWTSVQPSNVHTLKELMDTTQERMQVDLAYYRVPLTAELAPEPSDFDDILRIISQHNSKTTAFVLNCQIGMGRSTTGTVITVQVIGWLQGTPLLAGQAESTGDEQPPISTERLQYRIIHSLLRILRNSLEIKQKVDDIIDACSSKMNLRQNIEHWRAKSANEVDPDRKFTAIKRAAQNLRRYFYFIAFQAYLDQNPPESLEQLVSFEQWMKSHAEFETLLLELDHSMENSIIPVSELKPGDGVALTSEVLAVVQSRNGSVLAQNMILKYDRVEGAPNYRRLDMEDLLKRTANLFSPQSMPRVHGNIFGVAMPVKDAIVHVLRRIDPSGKLSTLWTSLREEPVLYVNGRPYVLRSFQDPLKNLEATGIVRERVESMENRMKLDAIEELKRYGGRLLLHGEESDGISFTVTPIWESLRGSDIQTPREVFEAIRSQGGFNVEYLRIPITDEQAPIPQVFDLLHGQVSRLAGNVNAIFNCQMGRGRTTTGMVIACIVEMARHGISRREIPAAYQENSTDSLQTGDDLEESERDRYLKGEYRIVLQLMRVLAFGKISKLVVDEAVDACSHVQNIRAAIYDFKLRVDAASDGKKKAGLLEIGINYLYRYFYLIVFASYVLEREGEKPEKDQHQLSFTDWLAERREITNVVQTAPKELV